MTSYFESAELVGLSVALTIVGGEKVVVAVGVSTTSSAVTSLDTMLALPMCTMFSGSQVGQATGEFSLPPDHGFGREVKAVSVGNPDPVLHILLDAEEPAVVMVRGYVELRLTGHGVPAPLSLLAGK